MTWRRSRRSRRRRRGERLDQVEEAERRQRPRRRQRRRRGTTSTRVEDDDYNDDEGSSPMTTIPTTQTSQSHNTCDSNMCCTSRNKPSRHMVRSYGHGWYVPQLVFRRSSKSRCDLELEGGYIFFINIYMKLHIYI